MQLPLMKQIIEQIEQKSQFIASKNHVFAKIHKNKKDKALAMLIKNPGLLTRKYN